LLQLETDQSKDPQQRQTRTAFLALQKSLETDADYVLFLEDDLDFNRHLWHNLQHWAPLRERQLTLAGLYNPNLPEAACDVRNHFIIVQPECIYGSQAFVISRRTVEHFLEHWNEIEGMQDIKMSRLAGRLGRPIYYHAPSLVQHLGAESLCGGFFHQAPDFDPDWKA
jgi:hypothetical protein